MVKEKEKSSDAEMTFFEHVEALRPHLMRAIVALLVVMVAAFIGRTFVIDTVLMSPSSPEFPTNRWLCALSHWMLGNDTLCINQVRFNMVNVALAGQFNLVMTASLVTAIVVAVPYLLWEIWRFVRPALTSYEQHKSRMFVFYVSLCFFGGLLFGYYVIVPLSINFLAGFQASPGITNMIDIRSYLTTVLSVSLACAAVFQLPLLVYFLARMGLITSSFLKKYRRHAIVLLAVLSAIITPPDLFSLVLVMMPLYGLYEYSIVIAGRVERKKAREEAAEEAAYAALPSANPDEE